MIKNSLLNKNNLAAEVDLKIKIAEIAIKKEI